MMNYDARKRLAEATPSDAESTPGDRDARSELLDLIASADDDWAGSPEQFGFTWVHHIADAILASDWLAEHDRRVAAPHRDLVSRLGFGDNITEPMADNDTIVQWFEQQGRDANEWQESQLWRNDCYAAGHPDDEDCAEHDPALRLRKAEAERDDLRALLAEHPAPEPPSDEASMHIDPEPPGVTLRPFIDAEVAALDASIRRATLALLSSEPPSGGEVTADELAEVLWDLGAMGGGHRRREVTAAAILARFDMRRKP